jgi:uncharacterized protein YbcI
MVGTQEQATPVLMELANAMVRLHKEQFGRGPTRARSFFAGPDGLMCVLEDVLLPAELKLVALGQADRVRDARSSFQVATADDFVSAVEELVGRKVRAFASAVDPHTNVVFENFAFEPRAPEVDGHGGRTPPLLRGRD